MEDDEKAREQLLDEIARLRHQVNGLKTAQEAHKKTEEMLRMYERIVSVSNDRLAFVDTNYIYRSANESYLRAHARRLEEVLGHSVPEVLGDDVFRDTVKHYLDECLSGKQVRYQAWFDIAERGKRYLDVFYYPFYESDGVVGGVVVSSRDITEQQQAEEARIEKASTLARTEELKRSRERIVNVQESLRKDIAHQLHGAVQNKLIVLLHQLDELKQKAGQKDMVEQLNELHHRLSQMLETDIRPLSHRLYPSILRQGLIPALQSLGDQFEPLMDIGWELDEILVQEERKERTLVPEPIRLAFYRIAEEALTNIAKHAQASKCTIALKYSPGGVINLIISDNGRGFKTGGRHSGLGMSIMKDYAELTGGTCIVRSSPGKGTKVTAAISFAKSGSISPEKSRSSE
jgi:PAS domain S-box-containing protein